MELTSLHKKMSAQQFSLFISNKDVEKILNKYDRYEASICMESDSYINTYLQSISNNIDRTDLNRLEFIGDEIVSDGDGDSDKHDDKMDQHGKGFEFDMSKQGEEMGEQQATPPAPAPPASDAFGMMLQSMIDSKLSTLDLGVSEQAVALEVDKALKKHVKSIEFKKPGAEDPVRIDNPHKSFEEMMLWINQGENVMLTGPAGSGKTTAGALAAEALKLPFGSLSLSNDTRAYALFGFTNGQNYTTTEFRRLYENGGVFILDEVDNGQANILSKLNSALENGRYAFDDKTVERHPDFVCISTANTWGHGGDREYVGRNALDAAFLDRFIKIDWGYDENLELRIAPDEDFTRKIQQIRAAALRLKYKIVVSPRASIRGGKMKVSGKMKEDKILDAVVWRGVSKDVKKKILANV